MHEHAFSFGHDLRPALARLGLSDFRVRYLNASLLFFLFFDCPVPRWLWRAWHAWDRAVAGRFTRWLCSAGVCSARLAARSTPRGP